MGTFLEDRDRNVIPRLRSFRTTLALGELDTTGVRADLHYAGEEQSLQTKIRAWRQNRSVSFASDLASAALVLQRPEHATDAARFLLSNAAPSAARAIAEKILDSLNGNVETNITISDVTLPNEIQIFDRIRTARNRLRQQPRNAVLWVELALGYALVGVDEKAERAMDTAVHLGPTNRFVLRTAARLYIHVGQMSKAHHILRAAESTKYDPWLLSAEIAVASAANRNSKFIRRGEQMLDDDSIAPFHKNELSSAMATIELSHGKAKKARNLFRRALIDPTENSVAQAGWAMRQRHIDNLDLDLERARNATPRSFEAGAWRHFAKREWRRALKLSLNWLRDQPFSKRPVLFASYIAASVLEDYRDCERIVEVGLRANPEEPILLNNLAFALASSDQIYRANEAFSKIKLSKVRDESEMIAITATQGLLLFRNGLPDAGRLYYKRAIDQATRRGFKDSRTVAAIYLAREEARLQTAETHDAVDFALAEANGSHWHIKDIADRILGDDGLLTRQVSGPTDLKTKRLKS